MDCVSGLESTLAGISVSVASKGVNRSEKAEALQASAGEEAPEQEGLTDLSGDQRLAEVPAARQMVQRREAAGVRMVLDQAAVRRVRIG
jgi:hypothetical protein